MSALSSALAAYLQNSDVIGPLVSGVISGRNFDLQDQKLLISPFTCISVIDLPSHGKPYVGTATSGNTQASGQIEVRIVTKKSEVAVKDLQALLAGEDGILWKASTLPSNGSNLPFGVNHIMTVPDSDEELHIWLEIMTIDWES